MQKKILEDSLISKIVPLIIRKINPEQIIIFGSRARGDFEQQSDYDIAIKSQHCSHAQWSEMVLDIQEKIQTLHKIDFVNLDAISTRLQNRIYKEGMIIYEKQTKI